MARPAARADKVNRDRKVTIRLAPDEVELVSIAATAEGLSMAEFLRGTAISASASYVPDIQHAGGAAST
jgi:predicted DNA binding CopG/RHH family protein